MRGARRVFVGALATAALILSGGVAAASEAGNAPHEIISAGVEDGVERLSGAGRYETSAAISRDTFEPGVAVAYIANGTNFPDALSGAAAAGAEGGPVLLTAADQIPQVIKDELTRLKPERIVVLGGKGAVADALLPTLKTFTVVDGAAGAGSVERLSGAGRYETSAAISEATFDVGVPIAYIASGTNFPDALSGGPAAGYMGGPVLLVTPTDIPPVVRAELERLNPQKIFVLGGKGAVSLDVLKELGAFVPSDSSVTVPTTPSTDDGTVKTYSATAEPITAWWGDSITLNAEPGFFTAGPDGDWTGDRGYMRSFIRENNCPFGQTEGFGFQEGPKSTTVSADGSTLTFELPDQPFNEAVWNLARTPSITVVGYAEAPAPDEWPADPCTLTGERFEVTIDLDMAAGRLSGAGRYDTSAVISAETFTPPVDVVYIANGLTFPDALSAAPAGGVNAGPVLLTDKASLPQATKDELLRLEPKVIRVLGGTGAVSASVMAELNAYVGSESGAGALITASPANSGPVLSNIAIARGPGGISIAFDYQNVGSAWSPVFLGLYQGGVTQYPFDYSTVAAHGYGLVSEQDAIVNEYDGPGSSGRFEQTFPVPSGPVTVMLFGSGLCDCQGGTAFMAGRSFPS